MARGILEGVRVIELGAFLALPLTGRILAALGAEVIKVETNSYIDPMNFVPAWAPGSGRPEFEALKRKITLDLTRPEAVPILYKLIAKSDVFMTNLRRHVLKRWDVDFPEIRAANPQIIIMWQTGCGSVGPYGTYKFYGYASQHICGIASMTGFPEQPLAVANTSYSDWHTGFFQPMAIIAALLRRKRTGKAAFLECSVFKSGVVTVGSALLDYQANKRLPSRIGNMDPFTSPHGIYPCKGEDRWCAIAVFTNEEWEDFCHVLGNPQWTKDAKFTTSVGRIKNAAELDRLVGEWTIDYTAEEVMEKMQKAGVPAGVVSKGQDLFESPQLRSRNFYREALYYVPDPQKPGIEWAQASRPTIACSIPIVYSETPCRFGPVRRIGEDNNYVYGELLGMTEEEINKLTNIGALR